MRTIGYSLKITSIFISSLFCLLTDTAASGIWQRNDKNKNDTIIEAEGLLLYSEYSCGWFYPLKNKNICVTYKLIKKRMLSKGYAIYNFDYLKEKNIPSQKILKQNPNIDSIINDSLHIIPIKINFVFDTIYNKIMTRVTKKTLHNYYRINNKGVKLKCSLKKIEIINITPLFCEDLIMIPPPRGEIFSRMHRCMYILKDDNKAI